MADQNMSVDAQKKSNMALIISVIAVVLIVVVILIMRNKSENEEYGVMNNSNTAMEENGTDTMNHEEGMNNETMPANTTNETNIDVNITTPIVPDVNEVKTFTVEAENFKFTPAEMKVKKGDKVKIVFTNKSGYHDFVLDEFNVKSKQSNGPSTETLEFTADKTGTFEYYCSVMQHRQMGMKGNLIVE